MINKQISQSYNVCYFQDQYLKISLHINSDGFEKPQFTTIYLKKSLLLDAKDFLSKFNKRIPIITINEFFENNVECEYKLSKQEVFFESDKFNSFEGPKAFVFEEHVLFTDNNHVFRLFFLDSSSHNYHVFDLSTIILQDFSFQSSKNTLFKASVSLEHNSFNLYRNGVKSVLYLKPPHDDSIIGKCKLFCRQLCW